MQTADPEKTYKPHPSEGQYEHTLLTGVAPGVDGSGTVPESTGIDKHVLRVPCDGYAA